MKNIIFDIGNVLLDYHPERFLKQYYDKETSLILMSLIFQGDDWKHLDDGTMMIADVIDDLTSKHPQYTQEITFVLKHWSDMMTPLQENVDLIKVLKAKGYKIYLLSNFHYEAFFAMEKKYDFLREVDGKVISAFEHKVKPDSEIYQVLLERYDLSPFESLFIDDSYPNIEAARLLGIQGIHFEEETSLKDALKAAGVL